jgi:hypothetical protein
MTRMKYLLSRLITTLVDGFAASAPYHAMPYFVRAYPFSRRAEDGR